MYNRDFANPTQPAQPAQPSMPSWMYPRPAPPGGLYAGFQDDLERRKIVAVHPDGWRIFLADRGIHTDDPEFEMFYEHHEDEVETMWHRYGLVLLPHAHTQPAMMQLGVQQVRATLDRLSRVVDLRSACAVNNIGIAAQSVMRPAVLSAAGPSAVYEPNWRCVVLVTGQQNTLVHELMGALDAASGANPARSWSRDNASAVDVPGLLEYFFAGQHNTENAAGSRRAFIAAHTTSILSIAQSLALTPQPAWRMVLGELGR